MSEYFRHSLHSSFREAAEAARALAIEHKEEVRLEIHATGWQVLTPSSIKSEIDNDCAILQEMYDELEDTDEELDEELRQSEIDDIVREQRQAEWAEIFDNWVAWHED